MPRAPVLNRSSVTPTNSTRSLVVRFKKPYTKAVTCTTAKKTTPSPSSKPVGNSLSAYLATLSAKDFIRPTNVPATETKPSVPVAIGKTIKTKYENGIQVTCSKCGVDATANWRDPWFNKVWYCNGHGQAQFKIRKGLIALNVVIPLTKGVAPFIPTKLLKYAQPYGSMSMEQATAIGAKKPKFIIPTSSLSEAEPVESHDASLKASAGDERLDGFAAFLAAIKDQDLAKLDTPVSPPLDVKSVDSQISSLQASFPEANAEVCAGFAYFLANIVSEDVAKLL